MDAAQVAKDTFENHLRKNSYPGRGLVLGRADDGEHWAIVYFIMGRSQNSRNRRFAGDGDRLWTEPLDPSKVEDPSLIIYDAMLALPGIQIVSNGDQTATVYNAVREGATFRSALGAREREPDSPNFTPRITAMLEVKDEAALHLSVLKVNPFDSARTDRYTIDPATPPPGFGYGLTTYMGDGSPLPSFRGDPLLLPLHGKSPRDILDAYWDALDRENRVALAVKWIKGKDASLAELLIRNAG